MCYDFPMDYLYALQCLREKSPEFINIFFLLISELMLKGGIMISAIIFWCFSKKEGSRILLTFSATYSANQLVKNLACIYRPWILDSRLYAYAPAADSATGFSFPSGHTVTAASVFGGIAVSPSLQKRRRLLVIISSLLIFLTAFSRNWLGAHTAKDVIAASVLGCIGVCCAAFAARWLEQNPHKDTLVVAVAVALSVLILVFLRFKPYSIRLSADGTPLVNLYDMVTDCFSACGLACGAFIGWWIERHFIKFNDSSEKKVRLVRAVIGVAVDFAVYASFGKIFSFAGEHASHLIKYFTIMICTFVVCPLIFRLFERD